jgi:hypothetical protein
MYVKTHIFSAVLLAMVAVGAGASFQSVRAQCAPGSKIFIDPRLVPHRMQVGRQQFLQASAVLTHNPNDPKPG